MSTLLPNDARTALDWEWADYQPHFEHLAAQELNALNVASWLAEWSHLSSLLSEVGARLNLAYNQDTTDTAVEQRFFHFLEEIVPAAETAEQQLKQKLLTYAPAPNGTDLARTTTLSEVMGIPPDMAIPLRNLRAEAALFREANLPLQVEVTKLESEYEKLIGAETILWEGQELPLPQLRPLLNQPDRTIRQQVWQLAQERRLADRDAITKLWQALLALRVQIATNAGCSDYREYTWRNYQRFDYTLEDTQTFQHAIETTCVPPATRIYDRHRQRLGLETLRPWDLTDGLFDTPTESSGLEPLRPYRTIEEFLSKTAAVFHQVDPQIGRDFDTMLAENLLDVDNRKGKAPGGYQTFFAMARRPFIFMNSVGVHQDVQTMLHEVGHALHSLSSSHLPYFHQLNVPMEFNEVASMAMELLAAPYLSANSRNGSAPAKANGTGFYTAAEAARARLEHLEHIILIWPYVAVVDAFQHWAYTHVEEASDSANCDAQWLALMRRFIPGVDWSGLETDRATSWQRRLHIFVVPFYYIEYGLAQLGAVQVWRNALQDQASALARYRAALKLGGTSTLPELYAAAGARFAFDAETMGEAVALIEEEIERLEIRD